MAPRWCYTADGKTALGPFSLEQMQELARLGQLKPSMPTRHEQTPTWAAAGTFPELFPQPLVAMPVATASRPTPQPESLFDFDSEQPSAPGAPPAKRHDSQQPAWAQVWLALVSGAVAVWSVPLATWKEGRRRISLFSLRKRLRQQRLLQEQLLVDLGARLLTSEVSLPGFEEPIQSYQFLSQSHQLAQRQGSKGNKEKRREATRLAGELRSLSIDFGRKALDSDVSFVGRPTETARKKQIDSDIGQTQEQIDAQVREWATAPPQTRWRVLIGSSSVLFLVVFVGWLCFPARSGRQPKEKEPVARKEATRTAAKTPETKKTLQELFVLLAPAVPLVNADDSGNGSGFLIKHKGRYLVITNRHVVENAPKGVSVHFPLKGDGKLIIPGSQTKVIAIHRTADVAVVDVHEYAPAIERMQIQPLKLAPTEKPPLAGEDVFAIGHPGGRGTVLTSTLSKGIISAVDRHLEGARYMQVTAAINPGNSGGPVFDSQGRVIGVATFTMRGRAGGDVPLESLNFALQVGFVHEILTRPSASLKKEEIAAIVNPPPAKQTESMKKALAAKLERLSSEGYKPPTESETPEPMVFRLGPGDRRGILIDEKGQYAVVIVSEGVDDLDLLVLDVGERKVLAESREPGPNPEVKFKVEKEGLFIVFVRNSKSMPALVSVTLLKK